VDDLVQWFGQQLDEDERIARRAGDSFRQIGETGVIVATEGDRAEECASANWAGVAEHIVAHDPARVLREIDADRALVDAYAQACRKRTGIADEHWGAAGPSGDLSAVERWKEHDAVAETLKPHVLRRAAVYADRPGYREEWRP
jgi:hypothetical protein